MVFGPPGYISILTISKVLRVLLYMKAGILSTDTFLVEWKRAVYITIDYRVLATNRWCIYKTNIVCAAEGDSVCFDHSWATPTRKFWNRMFPQHVACSFFMWVWVLFVGSPQKRKCIPLVWSKHMLSSNSNKFLFMNTNLPSWWRENLHG